LLRLIRQVPSNAIDIVSSVFFPGKRALQS